MIKKLTLSFIFLFFSNFIFCSNPILVNESTIILDHSEAKELYFSFAEGDKVILDLEMIKGKHIKEVEITGLPSTLLLTEYKVRKLSHKQIHIRNKGVYKFKFYSSSLTRRVCKIKIYRIPKDENTKLFNTNWKWEVKQDTLFIPYQKDSLVGYKTIKYEETIKELKESKLEEIILFDKSQKVHSFYNENISRTHLKVDLPLLDNSSPLKEEKLIAWSYWISVGQEGREAYKKNLEAASNIVGKAVELHYQNPLASLAIGKITELIIPQTGEDITYYFIQDFQNVQLFYNKQTFRQFDMGKGRAAYGRNDRLKSGTFYIGLVNDNLTRGVDVDIKVLAVKEVNIYENVKHNREKEEPQYVTLNKTRIEIKETRFRVPVE